MNVNKWRTPLYTIIIRQRQDFDVALTSSISPDKARKGVIYPPKTGIYAQVGISERTFTR